LNGEPLSATPRKKEVYDKNLAERTEKEQKTGKKPGGPKPQPADPWC